MYPGKAYQEAYNLMIEETTKMFVFWENESFEIGYNLYSLTEILVEFPIEHADILFCEDDKNAKYLWEMRYDEYLNGFFITFKKQNSFFTQFAGRCFAKKHFLEFMPTFTYKHNMRF